MVTHPNQPFGLLCSNYLLHCQEFKSHSSSDTLFETKPSFTICLNQLRFEASTLTYDSLVMAVLPLRQPQEHLINLLLVFHLLTNPTPGRMCVSFSTPASSPNLLAIFSKTLLLHPCKGMPRHLT